MSGGKKFVPLLSKVCRRIESRNATYHSEEKVQPVRCWGYRKKVTQFGIAVSN